MSICPLPYARGDCTALPQFVYLARLFSTAIIIRRLPCSTIEEVYLVVDCDQVPDYRRTRSFGFRTGKTKRQVGRFGCRPAPGDGVDAHLALCRTTARYQNCQPRLVYLLVCVADLAHVFGISMVAWPGRVLASARRIRRHHYAELRYGSCSAVAV